MYYNYIYLLSGTPTTVILTSLPNKFYDSSLPSFNPIKSNLFDKILLDVEPVLESGQTLWDHTLRKLTLLPKVIKYQHFLCWGGTLCYPLPTLSSTLGFCLGWLCMLSQLLWVLVCNCCFVCKKFCFLVTTQHLWLLQSFCLLFINAHSASGGGSMISTSYLGMNTFELSYSLGLD